MSVFITRNEMRVAFTLSFADPKIVLMVIHDPQTDSIMRIEMHHDDATHIANAMLNAALDAECAPPKHVPELPIEALHPRAEQLLSNINPRYWLEE